MVVARGGHGDAQQILVFVHGLDDGAQEQQELGVLIGGGAGIQQVHPGVGGDGPVVVLAGAVDPVEGLLMEQAHQAMALGNLLHHLHGQLIVVGCDVGGGEDGSQLMLGWGHLVVLGLGQDTQLPQLVVQLLHVGCHPGLDGAEVMIVQLLTLGGLGAEEGAAGVDQVLTPVKILLVHQEVLLLGADGGLDGGHIGVAEELQHPQGLTVDGFHGPQQSGLLVQSLAAVGQEHGGDAQNAVLDEGIGGGIPGGVASGLEGGTQAAGGEGGGVGLALNQLFAGEFHDDLSAGLGGDEAVVLLGGDAGHGLEPVGEMGGALFHGPLLHGLGDLVGGGDVQRGALGDAFLPGAVGCGRQALFHGLLVEDQAAEQFGELFRCTHTFHPPIFLYRIVS